MILGDIGSWDMGILGDEDIGMSGSWDIVDWNMRKLGHWDSEIILG